MSEFPFINRREVAALAGIDYQTVPAWIGKGRLPAPVGQFGLRQVWDRGEVERKLAEPPPPSRPEGFLDTVQIGERLGLAPVSVSTNRKSLLPEPEAWDSSGRGKPRPLWSPETVDRVAEMRAQPKPPRREEYVSSVADRPPVFDDQVSAHDRHPGGWLPEAVVPIEIRPLIVDEFIIDVMRSRDRAGMPLPLEDCFASEMKKYHPQEFQTRVFEGQIRPQDHLGPARYAMESEMRKITRMPIRRRRFRMASGDNGIRRAA